MTEYSPVWEKGEKGLCLILCLGWENGSGNPGLWNWLNSCGFISRQHDTVRPGRFCLLGLVMLDVARDFLPRM